MKNKPNFSKLNELSAHELTWLLGLSPWKLDTGTVYLFPGRLYNDIPDGTEIVFIDGKHETFIRGVTDDDTRFGYLAFGVFIPNNS